MIVIGGSASKILAARISQDLESSSSEVEIRKFPDGEKYVRVIDNVAGEEVLLVQSLYHNPDEYLMELLFLTKTLKELGAARVVAVIPYFAYARQDERFHSGESTSFEIVSKFIEYVGVDEIYTIDMHLHRVPNISCMFKIQAHNLSAVPLLIKYIREKGTIINPLIIGPDEESEQWVSIAAKEMNADYDILEKKRFNSEKVDIKSRKLELRGRDVLIIDDIISTGGTIIETIKSIRENSPKKIVVACTHPVLVGDALRKIHEAGAHTIIGTDTIPGPISCVSVSELIAEAVKKSNKTSYARSLSKHSRGELYSFNEDVRPSVGSK